MKIRTDPYPAATLPAGEYYVGDPCYVFPTTGLWEDWIERAEAADREGLDAAEAKGCPVAACEFVSGIGDVTDQDDFEYVEDSSLIGAVPVELAEVDGNAATLPAYELRAGSRRTRRGSSRGASSIGASSAWTSTSWTVDWPRAVSTAS